jgi:hypothetical protein
MAGSALRFISIVSVIALSVTAVHGLSSNPDSHGRSLSEEAKLGNKMDVEHRANVHSKSSEVADKAGSKRIIRKEKQDGEDHQSSHSSSTPAPAPAMVKWVQDENWCLSVNKTNATTERIGLDYCGHNHNPETVMHYMTWRLPPPEGEKGKIQWDKDPTQCLAVHGDWHGDGTYLELHDCDDHNAEHAMVFTHTGGRAGETTRQKSSFEWDCGQGTGSSPEDSTLTNEVMDPNSECVKCVDVLYEYYSHTKRFFVQIWDRTNAPAQLWRFEEMPKELWNSANPR